MLYSTSPYLVVSTLIGVDVVIWLISRGTVFVPVIIRVAASIERERQILKRRPEPETWISRLAFYTNPLMPLAMATFTFLEGKPVLEATASSLHDSVMMTRRRTVVRVSTDWNDHRLRGAAA